jgi:Arc/MetJ family transcription regulator
MRTNIFIDDAMMKKAMDISGLKTKKEVVAKALHEFVVARSQKDLIDLKGKIRFSDDYDYKQLRDKEGY